MVHIEPQSGPIIDLQYQSDSSTLSPLKDFQSAIRIQNIAFRLINLFPTLKLQESSLLLESGITACSPSGCKIHTSLLKGHQEVGDLGSPHMLEFAGNLCFLRCFLQGKKSFNFASRKSKLFVKPIARLNGTHHRDRDRLRGDQAWSTGKVKLPIDV